LNPRLGLIVPAFQKGARPALIQIKKVRAGFRGKDTARTPGWGGPFVAGSAGDHPRPARRGIQENLTNDRLAMGGAIIDF
jgi:hypothetical protein